MAAIIYSRDLGPFNKTTYGFFVQTGPATVWIYYDEGPEFNTSLLFDDRTNAFKFPAGTYWRIQIIEDGGDLQYQVENYTPAQVGEDRTAARQEKIRQSIELLNSLSLPGGGPGAVTCAGPCGEVDPCLPPTIKLDCSGTSPTCVEPS
ncbi:MAG: hypothetical protein AB8B50_09675 [Pirellulaceae bacterium]